MSDVNLQITARGPRAEAEAAAAAIDADPRAGGQRLLDPRGGRGARASGASTPIRPRTRRRTALRPPADGAPALQVGVEPLADADWLALALSGLPPVRAGRFFVYGAHDRGRIPANAVGLRIEAGAAFGTGHHGTTAGCLLAFDALLKARRFAARAGRRDRHRRARHRRRAHRQPRARSAPTSTRSRCGSPARTPRSTTPAPASCAPTAWRTGRSPARAPYDLVFANILARPLVRPGARHPPRAEARRVAILSGLLRSQQRFVARRLPGARLPPAAPHPPRRLGDPGAGAALADRGRNRRSARRAAFRPQPIKVTANVQPDPDLETRTSRPTSCRRRRRRRGAPTPAGSPPRRVAVVAIVAVAYIATRSTRALTPDQQAARRQQSHRSPDRPKRPGCAGRRRSRRSRRRSPPAQNAASARRPGRRRPRRRRQPRADRGRRQRRPAAAATRRQGARLQPAAGARPSQPYAAVAPTFARHRAGGLNRRHAPDLR